MSITNTGLIKGRLASQPRIQQNNKGLSVSIMVAIPTTKQVFTNGRWETENKFLWVTVRGQAADYLIQYGQKGTLIAFVPFVQSFFNKDTNGKTYLHVSVSTSDVEVLGQPNSYYENLRNSVQSIPANGDYVVPGMNYADVENPYMSSGNPIDITDDMMPF